MELLSSNEVRTGLWPEPTMVSHFLGPRITNNEAEYEGVLMSLKLVYQKLVDLPDDRDHWNATPILWLDR